MTKTQTTKHVDRWIDGHRLSTMDERFDLAEAIQADGLTAEQAIDHLAEREVDLSPGTIREIVVIGRTLTRGEFQELEGHFASWSAIFEWARAGADRGLLNKLPHPIKVDALRQATGRKPTNRISERVKAASTNELLGELNTRMDDERIVNEVVDTALKAADRNRKRRLAESGAPAPARIPTSTPVTRALDVMAEMQIVAERIRNLSTLVDNLGEVARAAAVEVYEQTVSPADATLRLSLYGVEATSRS